MLTCCLAADPERSPATVDAEVDEVLRRGPRGAPGAPRHEDRDPIRYWMIFTFHDDRPGTRDANDQHVYLVIYVLSDTPARPETDQVGVEVSAPLEGPDHALPPGRGSSLPKEVYRNLLPHTPLTLTRTTTSVSHHVSSALGNGGRSCTLSGYDEMVRRGVKEQEGLRLELSSEGRYALRALLYLAWIGERVPRRYVG